MPATSTHTATATMTAMTCARVLLLTTVVLPGAIHAQQRTTADGAITSSLGQPGFWKWNAGVALGASRRQSEDQRNTELRASLSHDVFAPVLGIAALQLEPFGGTRNGALDGGVRARLASPFLRMAAGADYNVVDGRARPVFSVWRPMRRGGVFTDGSAFRLDITPGRDWGVSIGLDKPIQRRIPAGKTRPQLDYVSLSARPVVSPHIVLDTAVLEHLAIARQSAQWIGRFTVPWLEHESGNRTRAESQVIGRIEGWRDALVTTDATGVRRPRLMDDEVRRFHSAMERAFGTALMLNGVADSSAARRVSATARTVLLDEVLLPYDRLLGQDKHEDTTNEFAQRARGIFLRWLHTEATLPAAAIDNALGVFTTLLEIVENNRASIKSTVRDARFVWLPLQYALLPEEHDSQEEIDNIVARAVNQRFADGNFISYVINEQFQFQLSRTIREARNYHVLWIHDIAGVNGDGIPDELTYRHVIHSYLHALTTRVREYDRTGSLPSYIILLDEFFYSGRQTRMWMTLLEHPLDHHIDLPRGYEQWEASIRAAQDSLREAVDNSRLLRAQRAQYGDEWMRELVKVHVNITNAADLSFWSRHVARGIAVPDIVFRDHRKIVVYDVSEDDPFRGEAILSGAGVGEAYTNLSWEDRALLVRGPVALQLKTAARELLQSQGFDDDRIPFHLRARPLATDYQARVDSAVSSGVHTLRAVGVLNNTGFGQKDINMTKAVLYTLMPAGSVIKIPDSIWNSAFWGSALIGSALRGVRVLIIAPSDDNAPARAGGSLELAYELLWRLLTVSQRLAPELRDRGGLLRVGIFDSHLQVNDIPGKIKAVRKTLAENEWLRTLFAFPKETYDGLAMLETTFAGLSMSPSNASELKFGPTPRLHLKSNTFASREAWELWTHPGWIDMTVEFVQQRVAQVQMRPKLLENFDNYPDATLTIGDATVQHWLDGLTPETRKRVVFYSVMGSQNQNARSMVMDGEVGLVISGWPSVIPDIDLLSVIGQSKWLDDPAELRRLLPPRNFLVTRSAHWIKYLF